MRYMGGKYRQSKMIAHVARGLLGDNMVYVEPFCGALWSAARVAHRRMILNDVCRPLILLWRRLYEGEIELPMTVTEDEYGHYNRTRDMDDPMTAYVGFGLSFGGKFFGGYARDVRGTRSFHVESYRGTMRKMDRIRSQCEVVFQNVSYDKMRFPRNSVVYADPPYGGRTKAHAFDGHFDTEELGLVQVDC